MLFSTKISKGISKKNIIKISKINIYHIKLNKESGKIKNFFYSNYSIIENFLYLISFNLF